MKKINIYTFKREGEKTKGKEKSLLFTNTEDLLKKIKNKSTHIYIYDKTHIYKRPNKEILFVNNHINKSGTKPPTKTFSKTKSFYDITQIYKQHPKGVVVTCLGERYKKEKEKHKNPCKKLPHIAVFLYINGYSNIYGRIVNHTN